MNTAVTTAVTTADNSVHDLAQLIYVSRRTRVLHEAALADVVKHSATRNARRNITGVLMCRGEEVMQLLEGERSHIVALFERIKADYRHTDVQQLLLKSVTKRLFPEWHMALADLQRQRFVDRDRLTALLDDVRTATDTGKLSVEARVLINDFRQQVLTTKAA